MIKYLELYLDSYLLFFKTAIGLVSGTESGEGKVNFSLRFITKEAESGINAPFSYILKYIPVRIFSMLCDNSSKLQWIAMSAYWFWLKSR